MIRITKDFHVEPFYVNSRPVLIHTTCTKKRENFFDYVSSIIDYWPQTLGCASCGLRIPEDVVNKLKFIYND